MTLFILWLLLLGVSINASYAKSSEDRDRSMHIPASPASSEGSTYSLPASTEELSDEKESKMEPAEEKPSKIKKGSLNLLGDRRGAIQCPKIFCQDGCFPDRRDRTTGCKLSCVCSDKKPGGHRAPTGTMRMNAEGDDDDDDKNENYEPSFIPGLHNVRDLDSLSNSKDETTFQSSEPFIYRNPNPTGQFNFPLFLKAKLKGKKPTKDSGKKYRSHEDTSFLDVSV